MNKRRVVITGLGCITALGVSADELYKAVCEGKSGISAIESFDVSEYPVKFGGEIKNFDAKKYIDHRESKRMDRFTQFALVQRFKPSKIVSLIFPKKTHSASVR